MDHWLEETRANEPDPGGDREWRSHSPIGSYVESAKQLRCITAWSCWWPRPVQARLPRFGLMAVLALLALFPQTLSSCRKNANSATGAGRKKCRETSNDAKNAKSAKHVNGTRVRRATWGFQELGALTTLLQVQELRPRAVPIRHQVALGISS
jgi:hypothetical protein